MISEARSSCQQVSLRLAFLMVLPILLLYGLSATSQTSIEAKSFVAIVCPKHPKDSRGEVVYMPQGKDEMDQPVVPGVLLPPAPIKRIPSPKYPKALRKSRSTVEVTVTFVITPDGDAIDLEVTDSTDQDASSASLDAVRKYRFKPATLDGKPVATFAKTVIRFHTW